MQEVFEKIIDELKQKSIIVDDDAGNRAVEIIEKVVGDYNNGWISSSKLPKTGEYVLLSFENFSVPMVGRYEEDDKGGAFYIGDEDETCVSQDMYVNAWQPLPEPYQPVSNDSTDAGARYKKSAWRDLILRNFMRGSEV